MFPAAAGIGFGEAARTLQSMRLPTIDSALVALGKAREHTCAAVILNELDPDSLQSHCAAGVDLCDTDLVILALQAINNVAPLYLEQIEMQYDEGDGLLLLPDPIGGYLASWEEWSDFSTEPGEYAEHRMYIFWTAIRLGDSDTLIRAGFEFGWLDYGMKVPDSWDFEIDWEKFERNLRERGLAVHIAGRAICWYDTGNDYFDWNPFDEDSYELPWRDFNLEGVHELMTEWEKAHPMLEDFKQARDQFDADPGLAGELLRIFLRSKKRRPRQSRRRSRTLAEIFNEAN
jgi:hypothetical protein